MVILDIENCCSIFWRGLAAGSENCEYAKTENDKNAVNKSFFIVNILIKDNGFLLNRFYPDHSFVFVIHHTGDFPFLFGTGFGIIVDYGNFFAFGFFLEDIGVANQIIFIFSESYIRSGAIEDYGTSLQSVVGYGTARKHKSCKSS